jgi:negative regulator of sigma E activity
LLYFAYITEIRIQFFPFLKYLSWKFIIPHSAAAAAAAAAAVLGVQYWTPYLVSQNMAGSKAQLHSE